MIKKLLGDRVLIEVAEGETKTAGGLIISKTEDPGEMQTGTVVVAGEGKDHNMSEDWHIARKAGAGETVIFQYGKKILVEGKEYQLVNTDDVIMVMKKSEDGISF